MRGEATEYSDVDIAPFVAANDRLKQPTKWYFYRLGYLVGVSIKSVEAVRSDIQRPERAIWVVPGLRDCRVLLDKDGSMRELVNELKVFRWEPLQEEADHFASHQLMVAAEWLHKTLSAATRADLLATSYAVMGLLDMLSEVVAVQRGIMVKSGNTYFEQVEESVGPRSNWTHYHRLAAGLGDAAGGGASASARGSAALRLYAETVRLMKPIMLPKHLAVAEEAARIAEEALRSGIIADVL